MDYLIKDFTIQLTICASLTIIVSMQSISDLQSFLRVSSKTILEVPITAEAIIKIIMKETSTTEIMDRDTSMNKA